MPTITELRQLNPAWANKSDADIAARAQQKGFPIDPEPASAAPTNGNGGATIPPPAAAGAQILADRNAKPHVWDDFAKKWGMTGEDLKNYAKSAATGVAKAATTDIPGLTAGNQLINAGVQYATGSTPAELVQSGAAAIGLPFHEARPGTADPYVESVSRFATMAPLGEGALAPRIMSAVGGGLASEGAGQLAQQYAPGLEGPARFLGGLGGGYAGGMATAPRAGPRPAIPTTAELKAQAGQQYKAAEESGKVVPSAAYDTIASQVNLTGRMSGADPDLTPKVTTAMKRVADAQGSDKTVRDMEMIRRKIAIAAGSVDPSERRIASDMRDTFDQAYQQLAPPEISAARATTRRYKGGEVLDEIQRQAPIKGAQYSQAGLENAYRERYRQLAMNPRKMRQFDPEAQAAITNVATVTRPAKLLRGVGKLAPTGVLPLLANIGAGGGAGAMFGSPILGGATFLGGAGLGAAAKLASTALTKRNVRAAEAAVRGDPQAMTAYQERLRALQEQRMRMLQQSLARTTATSGLL